VTQTFTFRIIDSCLSTVHTLPTISTIEYEIAGTAIVTSFAPFYDSIGICGSYTY
jgi:hypothetical protein